MLPFKTRLKRWIRRRSGSTTSWSASRQCRSLALMAQLTDPSPPPAETDPLSYYYLANLMVETNQTLQNFFGGLNGNNQPSPKQNVFFHGVTGSPFQMGGCQGCHGTQGQSVGGDMSVVVANAPFTSSTIPDTSDADDATLHAAALTRFPSLYSSTPTPHHSSPPPDRKPW